MKVELLDQRTDKEVLINMSKPVQAPRLRDYPIKSKKGINITAVRLKIE